MVLRQAARRPQSLRPPRLFLFSKKYVDLYSRRIRSLPFSSIFPLFDWTFKPDQTDLDSKLVWTQPQTGLRLLSFNIVHLTMCQFAGQPATQRRKKGPAGQRRPLFCYWTVSRTITTSPKGLCELRWQMIDGNKSTERQVFMHVQTARSMGLTSKGQFRKYNTRRQPSVGAGESH